MSLIDLPQTKWGGGTGRQVILKGDFAKIEQADGTIGHPVTSSKAASERITARSSAVGWNG